MKHSILILALSLGITALPSIASADDRDRYHDRDVRYDDYRDFRDGIRRLRDHYDRVRDDADHLGANRHQREALSGIRDGIDRVAGFVESGRFDPSRAREKISQLHGDLHNLSEDLRHNDRRPGFSIQIR